MKIPAITVLIWFALATAAGAQGAPSSKSVSSGSSSKASLPQIRSLVHDLQGRNEKLRDLNDQYRSLVEQKPQGDEAQLAKWNAALERLLKRIDEARAAVVETKQQLDQSAGETLPTALAKDVANARNEAEAQRAQAEQALKSKPAKQKPSKQKPVVEKPTPPIPDDL